MLTQPPEETPRAKKVGCTPPTVIREPGYCRAAAGWSRVQLPSTDGAHSVTITDSAVAMCAPVYGWSELRHAWRARPAPVMPADATTSWLFYEFAKQILPFFWGCRDPIVMLYFGTMIAARPGSHGFTGFTTDSDAHRLPTHLMQNPRGDAAACLQWAQNAWEDYRKKVSPNVMDAAGAAMRILNSIGYPRAGTADADADVVAVWRRGDVLVAAVRCERFGDEMVATMVAATCDRNANISPEMLRKLAAAGRAAFRMEFYYPRLVGCGMPA